MEGNWVVLADASSDEPSEVIEIKDDYFRLEQLIDKWGLENCHRPFTKNVVTILGTTSAGKSSFVNHFFQVGIKKVALEQMDTHFTIVETIPEEEFKKLAPNYKRKAISDNQIATQVQDSFSDARRNIVYAVLDTSSTIARHQQFENFSKVFRKHELVNSILINEYYLRGNEEELKVRKNTILIDSPGFTAETQIAKLQGNLDILQYMYTLSDLTLFFIASDSLNLVSSQISMLELSILYAFHGQSHFAKTLSELLAQKEPDFSFSIKSLFSMVLRSSKKNPVNDGNYEGTSYWDKVKFILSKIDNVSMRCVCEQEIKPEAQFFELGTILGRTLRFLKPPVFDQCFAIAVPEQQTYQTKLDRVQHLVDEPVQKRKKEVSTTEKKVAKVSSVVTADLERLKGAIAALNYFDTFPIRMDSSIQKMCEELTERIKNSWSHSAFLSTTDLNIINSIANKSKQRSIERAGGTPVGGHYK